MPLSEAMLRDVAGDRVFTRGDQYVRYVSGLRVTATHAYASVQAKKVYTVELDFSGARPDGWCTCLHRADDNFCKHLVAVGLAAIDSDRIAADDDPEEDALRAAIWAIDLDGLRELLLSQAQRDSSLRTALTTRASAAIGDIVTAQSAVKAQVTEAFSVRGHLDYRQTFGFASDVAAVLDDITDLIDSGAAEVVRPALLDAVTELREISKYVDDSGGVIGDQCQRAADLYATACRLGEPDPVELATWLVAFRAESPGWPELRLADFVDAFDDEALQTYRDAVSALDRAHSDRDRLHRYEVDRMLLELADHDGDIDHTVALLSADEHIRYGGIVRRLREVGRFDEAMSWIDRAVAEGKIGSHSVGDSYWLGVDDVAATYQKLGRIDDAVAVMRADFLQQPSVSHYRALLEFASGVNRVESEREWAFATAREKATDRFAHGALLVQLALAEGDIEQAWNAADEFGPGYAWKELVARGADVRPVDAAELFKPDLEKDLRYPNSPIYPDIAARLRTMAQLYEKAGRSADFASYIAQIRADYRRRPALMKALDAKGL